MAIQMKLTKSQKYTQRSREIRAEVLHHYGNECQLCREAIPQFLVIDHVLTDGRKQRKLHKGQTKCIARWLRYRNYPDGFRLLCFNCNHLELRRHFKDSHSDDPKTIKVRGWWHNVKMAVLDAYGGRNCSCCGCSNDNVLTIDHVNGGGTKERKSIPKQFGRGSKFYRWLQTNKYPAGYSVLCLNCNVGRSICGGICPHTTNKEQK